MSDSTPWLQAPEPSCDEATLNDGAAGVALALLDAGVAEGRRDLIERGNSWNIHAQRLGRDGVVPHEPANPDEDCGPISLLHTVSGVHWVAARYDIALARDPAQSVARFLAVDDPLLPNCDVTLGHGSLLVGCTELLRHGLPGESAAAVSARASILCSRVTQALESSAAAGFSGIPYFGFAHGLAGMAYALLRHAGVTGAVVHPVVAETCAFLTRIGVVHNQARRTPLDARTDESWLGWCHGSAGYVHFWLAAWSYFDDDRYLLHAQQAGLHAGSARTPSTTLCCGTAGQVYALASLFRATGSEMWLRRANELLADVRNGTRGAHEGASLSLFKGALGLWAAERALRDPMQARMPVFG